MECVVVFTNDMWVTVGIPKGHDPCWGTSDKYYYASSYTAAKALGFPEQRARVLAEALTSRRLYPGLVYEKSIEQDLRNLNTPSLRP